MSSDDGTTGGPSAEVGPTPRFEEPGARWRTVLWGPGFAGVGIVLELVTGTPAHIWLWLVVAVLLAGLAAAQVAAARMHMTVVVTDDELRQGSSTLPLAEIAEVLDAAVREAYDDPYEPWESAPAVGAPAVPRRRTGVGLQLTGGRVVQAWARDDDGLRAALRAAVDA